MALRRKGLLWSLETVHPHFRRWRKHSTGCLNRVRRTLQSVPCEALSLLRAAEFFLQLAIVHLEECWPAVRTGVGHRASAQVLDQLLQLRPAERVVRLDGVAANSFCHGLFAQPEGIDFLAGSHKFVNQLQHKTTR